MNEKNRRIITILSIFTIIFTVMGGSLAYWNWSSTTRTGVAFTIDKDFSCSADGGGNIAPTNISLEPSSCTNPNTTIKRKIVVTPDIKKSGLEISLDMWLNINSIGAPLSNSVNLKYVLTTSGTSCEEGTIISSGHFNSKTSGDRVMLLEKNYTADASETYYLYIWLDKEETSMDTMNQSFNFSLGGNCSNYVGEPEAPVLDPAMIPVTIANDGKVTTVSADDPNWYNYENKQWANVVLVNENATEDVTGSHPRSYYQNNIGVGVHGVDILAYYVWIPRYKYKLTQIPKCKELNNPNEETNPECYTEKLILDVSETQVKNEIVNTFSGDVFVCSILEDDDPMECSYEEADIILNNFLTYGYHYTGYEDYIIRIEDACPTTYYHYEKQFLPDKNIAGENGETHIVFESEKENMILGNATTEYRSHPAFWWDNNSNNIIESNETIAGIWVGKFETTDGVTVLSGMLPWDLGTWSTLSEAFTISINMTSAENLYGLDNKTTNSHIIKNSEWGAISYLTDSEFGISHKIIGDGCGSLDVGRTGCQAYAGEMFDYGYASTYEGSTTGNISGIFGISDDITEYVMGHYGITINSYDQSGFTQMPARKYYDLYTSEICTLEMCGGHALHETKDWYRYVEDNYYDENDPSLEELPVSEENPWYYRINEYRYGVHQGNRNNEPWRPVLIVGSNVN